MVRKVQYNYAIVPSNVKLSLCVNTVNVLPFFGGGPPAQNGLWTAHS